MKTYRIASPLLFSVVLLALVGIIDAPVALAREDASVTKTSTPIVVRTREEMQAFIDSPAFENSSLAILSPGARKRFVDGLIQRAHGIGGFDTSDLTSELTSNQIDEVMRLVDAPEYVGAWEGNDQPHARYALETDFDRRYSTMYSGMRNVSPSEERTVIRDQLPLLFPDGVSKESLSTLNNHDLNLAFRALQSASRGASPNAIGQMRIALDLLNERDAATNKQVAMLHDALVADRQFDDAESLENDFASVELTPVPRHRLLDQPSTGGPTLLSVFDGGNGLRREARLLDQGLHIVVVASCHFSQDAARAIEADDRMAALFHKHGIWLASADESFGNVANWNSEFPSQPIHIAWSDDEWSMLDSWAMPTFYVCRDGENIAQWAGWPADTGMQTLREQLDAAGVEY